MRYFLELRYNGAAYCGWQRQPDMPSVQQTLERALTTLLREKIEVTGAGRTDTGVNASYYVAHFDCAEPVPDPAQVVYKLNFLLPGDIAVGSMTPVGADAHARFAAREREYRYYIEPRKNPFTRDATWQYYVPLDMDRMNEAAVWETWARRLCRTSTSCLVQSPEYTLHGTRHCNGHLYSHYTIPTNNG